MILRIQRSEWFIGDLEHYAAWYDREASWEVAEQHLRSVNATLTRLAEIPDIGRLVFFPTEELKGLRCWAVKKPFRKHLIFYHHDGATLFAERVVHGAQDLPTRLMEPPGFEE